MLKTAIIDNFEDWMDRVVSVVYERHENDFTSDLFAKPSYPSIQKYTSTVLRRFETSRPFMAAQVNSPLYPHSSILCLPIAGGVHFYNSLPQAARELRLSWNHGERAEDRTFLVLALWRQTVKSMILGAELFIRGQFVQSQHIVRQFIEGTRLLFLCVTDPRFLTDVVNAPSSLKDFRQFWYKNLKPEKVSKRIEANRNTSPFPGYFSPFNSAEFFKNKYLLATQYTHLNPVYLWHDAFDADKRWLEVGLDVARFTDKMAEMIQLFELYSYTLDALTQSTDLWFQMLNDPTSSEFQFIVRTLPTTMVLEGLYHLSGDHDFYSDYPDGEVTRTKTRDQDQ